MVPRETSSIPMFTKLKVAHSAIRNWPMLFVDKLGLKAFVTYTTRNNLIFRCRSKSSDVGEVAVIVTGQEYPPKYLQIERQNAVVIDGGANIGAFSIYLASLYPDKEIRTYAFEPFPENYDLLETNLTLNNLNGIQAVDSALSDIDGTVFLEDDGKKDEVAVSTTGTGLKATAVRLSTFCKSNNIESIELLKLDVEGSEYAIIEADKEFIGAKVQKIIMEYHRSTDGRHVEWITEQLASSFDIEIVYQKLDTGVIFCRNITSRE